MRQPKESMRQQSSTENAVRAGFDPREAADTDALDRVRRRVEGPAPLRASRPFGGRRPMWSGAVAALALAAVLATVFVLGDARMPDGKHVVERAKAALAATRQPGMVTHEREVETYWERDPMPEGTERSFALTGTVVTETWTTYDERDARVEQWVQRDESRDWPMTLVRSGSDTARSVVTSAGVEFSEWIGVPSGTDARRAFPIHKALAGPALFDCSLCHAVERNTSPSALADSFGDERSVARSLLSLNVVRNTGRREYQGTDVWVLRSEGTTDSPVVGGRQRWLLELFVDVEDYEVLGARNRVWDSAGDSELALAHDWTYRRELIEAIDPSTLPADFFALAAPPEPLFRYEAMVATTAVSRYDRAPLYWTGPRLTIEPWADSSFAAEITDPWFTVKTFSPPDALSDSPLQDVFDRRAATEPTTALESWIIYAAPLEAGAVTELAIHSGPAMTTSALRARLRLGPRQRLVTKRLGGRPVSIVQHQLSQYRDPPGGLVPAEWVTDSFYVHLPDALVTLTGTPAQGGSAPRPLTDEGIAAAARAIIRAN